MKIKNSLRSGLAAFALVLAAVILGTGLMTCVYMLPTGRMLTNADRSLGGIETEGGSFYWAPDYPGARLDGYTDGIMLQTAVYGGTEDPLREAMLNRHMDFETGGSKLYPWEALKNYVYGARNGQINSYGRYWHGYLLFLKPALLFFDLSDIRMFLMTVQWCLCTALMILSYRRGGLRLAVPLGAAVLCLNPVSTAQCMQYTSMYLLTLVFAIGELTLGAFHRPKGWLIYLLLGILTAFFDFLTYPSVTFGICVTLAILLSRESGSVILRDTVRAGLGWGLGYAGMWSGKWVIASLLTGQNVLLDAVQSAQYRAGAQSNAAEGAQATGYPEVLARNLGAYCNAAYALLFGLLIALFLYLLLSRRCRFAADRAKLLSLGLMALLPFAWYFVMKNHSFVHYWMTHRNLSVTVLAVVGFFSLSLQDKGGTKNG